MTKEMNTLPFVHLPRYMRKEENIIIVHEDGDSKTSLIYKGKYPGIFPKEIKQIMDALDDPMLADKVILDYSSIVYADALFMDALDDYSSIVHADALSKDNIGAGICIVDGYEIGESKTNVVFNMLIDSENEEVL